MTTETRTLHFDLNHLAHLRAGTEFTLYGPGGSKHCLRSYAQEPHKLQEHSRQNKALAILPPQQRQRLTHFVEGAVLWATQVTIVQVLFPSLDDNPLPEIALRFVNIPKKHVAESLRKRPHSSGTRRLPLCLHFYGALENLAALSIHEFDAIHLDAQDIQPPYGEAHTLITLHPEIGSINSDVTQNVLENHIQNLQAFTDLYTYIGNNPPGSSTPYYSKGYTTWIDPDTGVEEPIPANTDLTYKDGQSVNWPQIEVNGKMQPVIPTRQLSGLNPEGENSELMVPLTEAVNQVLIAVKNDESLNGHLWTKQNGVTSVNKTNVPPTPQPSLATAAESASPGNQFVLKNLTSSYGVDLYDLQWDASQQVLTLPVKNWASRYLGAYVEFFTQDGSPINRSDITLPRLWDDKMYSSLQSLFEPSPQKNYLDWLSAGYDIFGVPVPPLDSVNNLSFMWPQNATSANVLFGGLGVAEGFSDWDKDVDVVGVLGTGIVCYGVTGLSMAFTVKIANPFLWGLKGDAKTAFYIVCGLIGTVSVVLGVELRNQSAGKMILAKLANMVAGIIFGTAVQKIVETAFKTALEEVIAEAVAEITTEEALVQIPIAGEILQVTSVASDLASLAATTIECFLSPATYKIEIQRQMNLTVTVGPDPTHGKEGHYVWPLVGDHYVIQVKYPKGNNQQGGTVYTQTGPMPGNREQPITVTFEGIPAGGKLEVVASIYSAENWLAGLWESGWFNASPDAQDGQSASGNITETLVPLTRTTTYSHKQVIAYSDSQQHYWAVTQFAIDAALASDLDKGGTPDGAVHQAFADNGNPLENNAAIQVNTAGQDWTLNNNGINFHLQKVQTYNSDGQTLYVLEVQNTTKPAPIYQPLNCSSSGNNLCHLQNITVNNREYQLGYAWQASGMNLPVDYGTTPQNSQMYAFQSISTLGEPEEQIIEPTRGFTNPTYLAYNQFGLKYLFTLAASAAAELNQGGAVPADIAQQFADFKLALPAGATVTPIAVDKDWSIGVAGQPPLYELQPLTIVVGGTQQNAIGVYPWPIPQQTNFYLDSRTYTPTNQLYYLRGVNLSGPWGESSFDYDTTLAWGAFTNVNIQALAVHPDGYVVGVDYDNHKLLALRLPAQAVDQAQAPLAAPLSGEGLRQGLLNKPIALTIAADGRILILEEGNSRIQAFDVKGNPVPCFAVGQPHFPLPTSFAAALDNWQAGDASANGTQLQALREQFQQQILPATAPLFTTDDLSSVSDLNNGTVDPALQALFVQYGHATSASQNNTPPTVTSTFSVTTTTADTLWLVTVTNTDSSGGPALSVTYDVRVGENDWGVSVLSVFNCFTFNVAVTAPGQAWKIADLVNAMTFAATLAADKSAITVQELSSFMPLRETASATLKYLDLAVEDKGYIYVLYQSGDQTNPTFSLDIYNPDGSVLLNNPQTGINAAKISVDRWRSLFSLNYEVILGPGQRTEPTVSTWQPSTPSSPTAS